MSEMVERVAAALCLTHPGIDWDDEAHLPHEDLAGTYTRPFFRRLAVAAIAAMREPTEAMCDSGAWGPMTAPDRVWQRMIDEATK